MLRYNCKLVKVGCGSPVECRKARCGLARVICLAVSGQEAGCVASTELEFFVS